MLHVLNGKDGEEYPSKRAIVDVGSVLKKGLDDFVTKQTMKFFFTS